MTIISKFPGTCRTCGGHISAGTEIEWEKGKGARHVACPTKRTQQARATRTTERRPRFSETAPEAGAVRISGRRNGRADARYTVGEVVHAPLVRDAGGGPDGHYYTVLAAQLCPPCEDLGRYDWTEQAWVRPATDAEAAPVAARIVARELRDSLARDLRAAQGARVQTEMPATAPHVVPRDGTKTCATGERVAIVDGAILHERVGDPDMCDGWYHYVVRIVDPSAELVARVQAFCTAVRA